MKNILAKSASAILSAVIMCAALSGCASNDDATPLAIESTSDSTVSYAGAENISYMAAIAESVIPKKNGWTTIGENKYFYRDGEFLTGVAKAQAGKNEEYLICAFDDSGAFLETESGIYHYGGEIYYLENGVAKYKGLVKSGDDYYYFNSTFKAVRGQSYGVTKTNGLLPAGEYNFDDNGVMTNAFDEALNGLIKGADGKLRYYENGNAVYAGLVCEGGEYYYINSTMTAVTNESYYITKTNGLIPAGEYFFGSDGAMCDISKITPDGNKKNGLSLDSDNKIRYYVNDVPVYAGLVKGAQGYYYINSTKTAVVSGKYHITKTNGLLPEGEYTFVNSVISLPTDENGDYYNGLYLDGDGEIRYYENGVPIYAGLVRSGSGNYYYINSTKKAVKNCYYDITLDNGLMPRGEYYFDENGVLDLTK